MCACEELFSFESQKQWRNPRALGETERERESERKRECCFECFYDPRKKDKLSCCQEGERKKEKKKVWIFSFLPFYGSLAIRKKGRKRTVILESLDVYVCVKERKKMGN